MSDGIIVDVRGQVGPQAGADGARFTPRQGKTGEYVVGNAHGWLYEAASRGTLFSASTAVAGVAPGTALGTTPPMALWNPTGSGVLVAIHRAYLGYISGTLGAGSVVHAQVIAGAQPLAPTSGTEIVPQCALLNGSRGKARAFQGSTVAATPTILRPAFVLGAGLASTAALPAPAPLDVVDGEIIIPEGAAYVLQGITAAGSTPLVLLGVLYEEIPHT